MLSGTRTSVALMLALLVDCAAAAVIEVTPGLVAVADDGQCSLIEAIENAEADLPVHADCTAGQGEDVILLPGRVDYVVSQPHVTGVGGAPSTGLPVIQSSIRLLGEGAVIRRDDGEGIPPFRLLSIVGGQVEIESISFRGGRIDPHPLLGGAAIQMIGGRLIGRHVSFEGNVITGSGRGGAVAIDGSSDLPRTQVSFSDCRFIGNAVQAESGTSTLGGGAISVDAATLAIERCAFIDNRAGPLQSGGALAGGLGGAIHATAITPAPGIDDTEVFISHSTFSGNVAREGGGIAAAVSTHGNSIAVVLEYVTLVANRTVGSVSAGLYGTGSGSIQFVYGSSVLHGNGSSASARDCTAASLGVLFHSLGRNLLDPTDFCPPDDELDILDVDLAAHLDLDLHQQAHLPLPDGVLVDATALGCVPGQTLDQNGRRRANGLGQGGSACDIGAVELYLVEPDEAIFSNGFELTAVAEGAGH